MSFHTPTYVEYNDSVALVLKSYRDSNDKDTLYDLYVFGSPSYVAKAVSGYTLFGTYTPVTASEVAAELESFNEENN